MESRSHSSAIAVRWLPALGILLLVLSQPTAAIAGGWASNVEVDDRNVAPGERVTAGTEFLFPSIEAAERARQTGSYYAYLLQGFDYRIVERVVDRPEPPNWWRLGGATAIRLGPVRLSGWDANLARARASFVVPQIAAGSYALMFCDHGCLHPLGDIVPAQMTVTEGPDEARLLRHIARLESRLDRQARSIRAALREARTEADATSVNAGLEARMYGGLAARVRDLEGALQQRQALEVPWLAFAGWFAAGAAVTLLGAPFRRLRKDRPVVLAELDGQAERTEEFVATTRR